MTITEAYDIMQKGYIVSHTKFAKGEFLYMNENFIIHDENGFEYEDSWDMLLEDSNFKAGWYIFKGVKEEQKKILGVTVGKTEKQVTYVSHIQGTTCVGPEKCLQFAIEGESACLFCDVNREAISSEVSKRLLLESINNDSNEEVDSDDIVDVAYIDNNQKIMQLTNSMNAPEQEKISFNFSRILLLVLCITSAAIVISIIVLLINLFK